MIQETVEVSGSYREQGRQHGEALASSVIEIIGEIVVKDGWDVPKVEAVLSTVEANLRRLAPGVVEEMHGIAEGSGVPYSDVLAYNAIADIWVSRQDCSATAWRDTPDGPIVGKTNDIGQHKEKYHQPFRRKSGEGLPAVWATWPGTVWTNCFVNGGGLAFGGASLGMDARNEEGISSNCMLRVIMDQCATVEDVLTTCNRIPIMHHPAHIVYADDTGAVVAVELTPVGTHACQGPSDAYVRATNHFCPGPHEGKDSGEERHVLNSKGRFANFGRLAESMPHTLDNMIRVVQDHAEEGQICQHGNADMWSSTGYVCIPRQRRMLIAQGQPCETEFEEVVL